MALGHKHTLSAAAMGQGGEAGEGFQASLSFPRPPADSPAGLGSPSVHLALMRLSSAKARRPLAEDLGVSSLRGPQ